MSNTLYHELLVEHFKYPLNKKTVANPTFSVDDHNPSCGDRIHLEGVVTDGILTDLGFNGTGCVISQATASMLTELCIGKTVTDIQAITPDDIKALVGIELGPTRLKCALLSLQALQHGLLKQ